jgi:hypothetical protein
MAFDDSLFDLLFAEGVNGVARHDLKTLCGRFGVEARRAVAATEDSATQVVYREIEHAAVFVE